ncbi:cation channel sperm-associated targeting subunit tau-like [Apostichopus japonicus]|uniref:cation channel sperm-associated targeting subunit tau-like n=1 Tax=Stichopus japonicus TaxID=307972 RepID=UPI003AB6623C
MSFTILPKKDNDNQEDGYNSARASYVTAPPSGVLSVHVKSLKLDENHFVVPEPEVYIRVRVGLVTKITKTVCPNRGKPTTVINDVKNFSLTLSRDRSAPQNQVRVDLIMVMTANVHRILGHKDMHIYDIIKNLYAAGSYDLRFRQQHVAYIEMEMCFAYGIFGFGYSHQLENRQTKAADIVSHSLLYRADPPDSRTQPDSLVMAPVHVNHPDFINFTEKMEIGPAAKQEIEILHLDPFENLDKEEPALLLKKMNKRLDKIRTDYSELGGRLQRKKFLEKLILRKAEDPQTETSAGDPQSENQPINQYGPGTAKGPNKGGPGQLQNLPNADFVTVDQTDAEYEEGEMNIIDLSSILTNAPGIVGRTNIRSNVVSNLGSVDQDSDVSGSRSTLGEFIDTSRTTEDALDSGRHHVSNTLPDLPSSVLNRFSTRLRTWRDRGATTVASREQPSGLVKIETKMKEP